MPRDSTTRLTPTRLKHLQTLLLQHHFETSGRGTTIAQRTSAPNPSNTNALNEAQASYHRTMATGKSLTSSQILTGESIANSITGQQRRADRLNERLRGAQYDSRSLEWRYFALLIQS
ncbi:hypothetical protein NM208_g16313 [Fusarium decemcellulare]|uniref:Uncharacterized protein n=1 Tax=Fusarium decemcellulare TaxID=57161 RepID=A0ACC1RCB2_9HYPO|nr:hypothetical protein NM208_g16313 [Fusarium decemcellulare]